MATETEKAYAAGLIDGEGCIGMYNTRPKHETRAMYFQVTVRVTMKYPDPILFLYRVFGGSLTVSHFTYKGERHEFPVWHARNLQAEEFLRLIVPYLILKKAQAELVLTFCELRRNTRAKMPRSERYSNEVLATYGEYVQKLKDMKRPAANRLPV